MKTKLITPKPEHRFIIDRVLGYYGKTYTELTKNNKTRNQDDVKLRYMTMYFLKKETDLSLAMIGALFGKDHATALHGIITVENNYQTYLGNRIETDMIASLLQQDKKNSTWAVIRILTGFNQLPDKKVIGYTWDDIAGMMEAYARLQTQKQVLMNFAEYFDTEITEDEIDNYINTKK